MSGLGEHNPANLVIDGRRLGDMGKEELINRLAEIASAYGKALCGRCDVEKGKWCLSPSMGAMWYDMNGYSLHIPGRIETVSYTGGAMRRFQSGEIYETLGDRVEVTFVGPLGQWSVQP